MKENRGETIEPSMRISQVQPIEESGGSFHERDEIRKYVEPPLVSACEHFWDLNITTIMSSANYKDIGGNAYIDLDYNLLSEENREIAKEFGKVFKMHGDQTLATKINIIPITLETTVEDVKKEAERISNLFKKQPLIIESYTIQQLRQYFIGTDPNDESLTIDDFSGIYYYDTESKKFYKNEEEFRKFNEETDINK